MLFLGGPAFPEISIQANSLQPSSENHGEPCAQRAYPGRRAAKVKLGVYQSPFPNLDTCHVRAALQSAPAGRQSPKQLRQPCKGCRAVQTVVTAFSRRAMTRVLLAALLAACLPAIAVGQLGYSCIGCPVGYFRSGCSLLPASPGAPALSPGLITPRRGARSGTAAGGAPAALRLQ